MAVHSLQNTSRKSVILPIAQDADLNFIKDATLDAAAEVESVTQYILQASKENIDFPNAAAVDYLHAVGLLSFLHVCKNCPCSKSQRRRVLSK